MSTTAENPRHQSGSGIVTTLFTLLKDPDPNVRQFAINAIVQLMMHGQSSYLHWPHNTWTYSQIENIRGNLLTSGNLATLLRDKYPDVREAAVNAIAEMSKYGKLSFSSITCARTHWETENSCCKLSEYDIVPAVFTLLGDHDPDVRQSAINTIVQLAMHGQSSYLGSPTTHGLIQNQKQESRIARC